jgi:hypothetical protein
VSQSPASINVCQPFHGLLNTVVNSAPRILVFLIVLAIGWIAAKVLDQTAQEPAHPAGYLQDPGSTEDYSREAGRGTGATPMPTTGSFAPCNFSADYCERRDRVTERTRPT